LEMELSRERERNFLAGDRFDRKEGFIES